MHLESEAAGKLGGHRASFGDLSAVIPVFPRIDAMVVMHFGDEEFPPEASILFRDDIVNHLPVEDVAVLSTMIALRLHRAVSS